MSNPYWAWTEHDAVMNEFELHFAGATDESSAILHRFVRAVPGTVYGISHNYWGRQRSVMIPVNQCACSLADEPHTYGKGCVTE